MCYTSAMNMTRRLLCYFIISVALLTVSANAWSGDWITAITIPSADVTLSFTQPGRIDKVYVREGDLVKANQTLVKQDDAAEQTQLLLIRKQSEDTNQIEAQKAGLAQKRVYLERLEWAAGRGSATVLEVEYAKLEVKKAELSLKEAEFGHEQNKRKYKEAKIRVNNMRLKSPIAGRVDKIEVEVGESINGLANVVRVVRTDPLWIEVHVPLEESRSLGLDQTAEIIFPGNEQKASKGKIIFISTVADAASSTLRVRIEVPNTSNRPAGEHASVLFPTPEQEVESNK
jgi:RND family efflux transporter MFP subunit